MIRLGIIGSVVLTYWKCICNNKNNYGKVTNFIKTTKTKLPTGNSGAVSLPPVGHSFMYIETSGDNHGHNRVFVSWERTDIIQITNITLYHNRFSILITKSFKSMGRFRIQLILEDNTSSTQYTSAENTQYSDNSSDWTLLNLDFTVEKYGIKSVYDQIVTSHADMCFSNITITYSVY